MFLFLCLILLAGCGKKEEAAEESSNEVYIAEYQISIWGTADRICQCLTKMEGFSLLDAERGRMISCFFLRQGRGNRWKLT